MNGDGGRIESLGLSPEMLTRVTRRTEQWADAIERELRTDELAERGPHNSADRERRQREVASLLAIAGSYRLLADVDWAQEGLYRASAHFAELGSAFAHPLAVCGRIPEIARRAFNADLAQAAGDRADALLAVAWLDLAGSGAEEARRSVHMYLERDALDSETPVGRLQIPYGAIARVVAAAESFAYDEAGPSRLVESLHDALLRFHDRTAAAMRDRFHWRRLMSGVLPVEPQAVALCAVAMAAARRHGAQDAVAEELRLPPASRVTLLIGDEIAARSV